MSKHRLGLVKELIRTRNRTVHGLYETEFFLTLAEVLALARFAKQVSWSDFTSHASGDDEAHLMKQAFDKLQDVLARSSKEERRCRVACSS